jgi:hypothetical protein
VPVLVELVHEHAVEPRDPPHLVRREVADGADVGRRLQAGHERADERVKLLERRRVRRRRRLEFEDDRARVRVDDRVQRPVRIRQRQGADVAGILIQRLGRQQRPQLPGGVITEDAVDRLAHDVGRRPPDEPVDVRAHLGDGQVRFRQREEHAVGLDAARDVNRLAGTRREVCADRLRRRNVGYRHVKVSPAPSISQL